MRALAQRHDPRPHPDAWGRPEGWAKLDIKTVPSLGVPIETAETAPQARGQEHHHHGQNHARILKHRPAGVERAGG